MNQTRVKQMKNKKEYKKTIEKTEKFVGKASFYFFLLTTIFLIGNMVR